MKYDSWYRDWPLVACFVGVIVLFALMGYLVFQTEIRRAFLRKHCAFSRTAVESGVCPSVGMSGTSTVVIMIPCTVTKECYVCDGGEECL